MGPDGLEPKHLSVKLEILEKGSDGNCPLAICYFDSGQIIINKLSPKITPNGGGFVREMGSLFSGNLGW